MANHLFGVSKPICSITHRFLFHSVLAFNQGQAFNGIGNKIIACCSKLKDMTKKDKINIALLSMVSIHKNVINAINKDVEVKFVIEVNEKTGKFNILITTD